MTDYSKLRELAAGATGGDWEVSRSSSSGDRGIRVSSRLLAMVYEWGRKDRGQAAADAEYIAAASPIRVLAILDELAKATAELAALREHALGEPVVISREVQT